MGGGAPVAKELRRQGFTGFGAAENVSNSATSNYRWLKLASRFPNTSLSFPFGVVG